MTQRSPNSPFRLLRPFKDAGVRLGYGRPCIIDYFASPAFETDEERAAWVRKTIWTIKVRPVRDPGAYACWMAQGHRATVLTPEEEAAYQADVAFGLNGDWTPLPVRASVDRPPKAEQRGSPE